MKHVSSLASICIIHNLFLYLRAKSSKDYRIERLGLFENDRNVLLSSIYAAQQLMKLSIPVGTTGCKVVDESVDLNQPNPERNGYNCFMVTIGSLFLT